MTGGMVCIAGKVAGIRVQGKRMRKRLTEAFFVWMLFMFCALVCEDASAVGFENFPYVTGEYLDEERVDKTEWRIDDAVEGIDGTEKSLDETKEPADGQEGRTGDFRTSAKILPKLPWSGREISDFLAEGWELMDSVTLDFNRDGIADYVGVQQKKFGEDASYPVPDWRILFAIASEGQGEYRLDFWDANLVPARREGGMTEDAYLPLTADGASFTVSCAGDSAWRWWEESTYTYRNGTWYLALSESEYGCGAYVTSYKKDDWEKGVGIRKERSSDWKEMEKHAKEENPPYDLVYELSLDEAPTLRQASMRRCLATDRVTDWEVSSIKWAEDAGLVDELVTLPGGIMPDLYHDEDCVLYTINPSATSYYVAMYRWSDKTLSVLAKERGSIDHLRLYKGKIYYAARIVENVAYKAKRDGREIILETELEVGISLKRMDVDGTNKEVIFAYRHPLAEQESDSLDRDLTSARGLASFSFPAMEISGDEIVVEVYVWESENLVYRMNTDGSGLRMIGKIPNERTG